MGGGAVVVEGAGCDLYWAKLTGPLVYMVDIEGPLVGEEAQVHNG